MLQAVQKKSVGLTERRKNQRLDIQVVARLKLSSGVVYEGVTRNLSYSGAFVELNQTVQVPRGEYCVFALEVTIASKVEEIKLICKVTHVRPEGVAVQHKAVSEQEYNKFVLFLSEHFPEANDLMQEMDADEEQYWMHVQN